MSNKVTGKVDFEVDGKSYALHFTANGMCELEEAADCTAMAFLKRLENAKQEDMSFSDVRLLFWAGLQEHHPDMTVRDAGALMTDMGGITAAVELTGRAVGQAFPEPADGGAPAKEKKRKGTS